MPNPPSPIRPMMLNSASRVPLGRVWVLHLSRKSTGILTEMVLLGGMLSRAPDHVAHDGGTITVLFLRLRGHRHFVLQWGPVLLAPVAMASPHLS